ncbi:MAG TPA: hypothetical protein VFP96_08560 [Candidatus Acidoferrum sp.]|nr:hypothetical protein [Candidatus Acidoferrum sp.]
MENFTLREAVSNAIKFWEPRRILYNVLLAAIVIGHFFYFSKTLANMKSIMSFDGVLGLFLLAVLANVAYCAAYPVDLFAQWSSYREVWLRYRWLLFILGLIFAAILTRFFSLGMLSGSAQN